MQQPFCCHFEYRSTTVVRTHVMKKPSLTKNWFCAVVISLCVFATVASNKPNRKEDKQKKQSDPLTTSHSLTSESNQSISGQSSSDDQRKTEVHSRHFQQAFDSSLAHIFRMNSRPIWNQSSVRIPEYMLNLYNDQFSEEARSSGRSSDTAGRRKRHSYPSANTIRSFNSEGQFRLVSLQSLAFECL